MTLEIFKRRKVVIKPKAENKRNITAAFMTLST